MVAIAGREARGAIDQTVNASQHETADDQDAAGHQKQGNGGRDARHPLRALVGE